MKRLLVEIFAMVLKICGGAILAAVLGFILSELGFRGKKAFTTLMVVIFLLIFVDLIADATSQIMSVSITDEGKKSLALALKVVGVGHAFNISADACAELSENGIASVLTLVGRLEILIMILPYAIELIKYSTSILR
jgi:hypothetical protein